MSTALLLIDAQVDFCDPNGALYVNGAEEDMARAAAWIIREQAKIDSIVVTLDSHHLMDIAHPGWWIDPYGGNPTPFTTITVDDLKKSRFNVSSDAYREASVAYVQYLAEQDKKTLVIWPPHCLIGHPGHALYPPIREAVDAWELAKCKPVEYVLKGMNPLTEHYSAVQAEKLDPNDPGTALNGAMIHLLDEHDQIVVMGEALSHCVADTMIDLMEHIDRSKFVILEDASSSVPGFESLGTRFLYRAKGRGAAIAETESFVL